MKAGRPRDHAPEGHYTTAEAAERLGVTPARIRQRIKDGTLPEAGPDLTENHELRHYVPRDVIEAEAEEKHALATKADTKEIALRAQAEIKVFSEEQAQRIIDALKEHDERITGAIERQREAFVGEVERLRRDLDALKSEVASQGEHISSEVASIYNAIKDSAQARGVQHEHLVKALTRMEESRAEIRDELTEAARGMRMAAEREKEYQGKSVELFERMAEMMDEEQERRTAREKRGLPERREGLWRRLLGG